MLKLLIVMSESAVTGCVSKVCYCCCNTLSDLWVKIVVTTLCIEQQPLKVKPGTITKEDTCMIGRVTQDADARN